LYSIDLALDELQSTRFYDWVAVSELVATDCTIELYWLRLGERWLGAYTDFFAVWRARLEALKEKRAIIMLISYVEAHERAAVRIHEFITGTHTRTHIFSLL
jgi:hypothetical protein